MIQVYKPENKNYSSNGDMPLCPDTAEVFAEINGTWKLELHQPIDLEERWKALTEESVVKIPSFNGEQMFRLKQIQKTESGIMAVGEPIFMDSKEDCFLKDIRPTEKNGQEALNLMLAPNKKYSGKSDITGRSTAYYEYKNLIEALNGNDDNSFVNRWGGEILFDNYTVIVNKRIGGDYGVSALYGKNIKKDGVQEEIDTRDVVTRIYPKAYNGYKLSGEGYVDSSLINTFPTVKTATISFEDVKMRADASEDDAEKGITICDTQAELDSALKNRCKKQFEMGIDKPKVTISVELLLIQNTDEYKDYKNLEKVSLGDTVHCRHDRLGIVTDARVISLTYDCLSEKTIEVKLGDYEYNYFDRVSSAVNRIDEAIRDDGTVKAGQVQGIIDGIKAQMRAQSTAAKKTNERAVLMEDLDKNSPTYGAMCFGTMGFQIASKRTADDRDWDWRTFGTGQGFFADLIVAGTMLADRIRGGELLSQNYKEGEQGFAINLNQGTIRAAEVLFRSLNNTTQAKCSFRFKNGVLELLDQEDKSVTKMQIFDYKPGDDPSAGSWHGRFEIETKIDGGYTTLFSMSSQTGSVGLQGKTIGLKAIETVFEEGKKLSQKFDESTINGKSTKTGRAEFSDGTYLEFVNGYLVGGNAKAGGF